MSDKESTIRLHPDGYVEIVLQGLQSTERFEQLAKEARRLVEEQGPCSILADCRRGRIGRDARSFAVMLGIGRIANLQDFIILIEPSHPESARRSSLIVSLIATALGLQPIYMEDEEKARTKAAG